MLDLSLSLFGRGWVQAKLNNSEDDILVESSYLSDGVKDLLASVVVLLKGNNSSVCRWRNEPGELRWLFEIHKSTVIITIASFERSFSRLNNNQGKVIFTANEDLLRFSRVLSREMESLNNIPGDKSYKEIWGYEFPYRELEDLRSSIKSYKYL